MDFSWSLQLETLKNISLQIQKYLKWKTVGAVWSLSRSYLPRKADVLPAGCLGFSNHQVIVEILQLCLRHGELLPVRGLVADVDAAVAQREAVHRVVYVDTAAVRVVLRVVCNKASNESWKY